MDTVEFAKSKYHGPEGYNCVQAVLAAFLEEAGITEAELKPFSAVGGGRAEGGMCGALYAARMLLKDSGKLNKIEELYMAEAGSLKCREILEQAKLTCPDCVGLAAKLVACHLADQEPQTDC